MIATLTGCVAEFSEFATTRRYKLFPFLRRLSRLCCLVYKEVCKGAPSFNRLSKQSEQLAKTDKVCCQNLGITSRSILSCTLSVTSGQAPRNTGQREGLGGRHVVSLEAVVAFAVVALAFSLLVGVMAFTSELARGSKPSACGLLRC